MRWLVLLALCGCIHEHYNCATDGDCNIGVAGRCESDHFCTFADNNCPLGRRYSDYADAKSNQCFDDAIAPLDPCAAGQPPSVATDACSAKVCQALPSCCTTGWSDACVQQAIVRCGLRCDVRIAVMAAHGAVNAPTQVELYDLRATPQADGTTKWAMPQRLDQLPAPMGRRGFLTWLAPAPGQNQPRLVGLDAAQASLAITAGSATTTLPVGMDRQYDGLASVDIDRDGRDTAVLASIDGNDNLNQDVLKLDTGKERELMSTNASPLETWGDFDADPFPDPVTVNGGSRTYRVWHNFLPPGSYSRGLEVGFENTTGVGSPPLASFDWADLNRDGRMDLVSFGAEIRSHYASDPFPVSDGLSAHLDCNPVATIGANGCTTAAQQSSVAFAGVAVFGSSETTLVYSVDDTSNLPLSRSLNLWRLHFSSPTSQSPKLPGDVLGFAQGCQATSPACPVVRAVVARDIDGDGILDLVAIDSNLVVWAAASRSSPNLLVKVFALPTSAPGAAFVKTSVSGAVAP